MQLTFFKLCAGNALKITVNISKKNYNSIKKDIDSSSGTNSSNMSLSNDDLATELPVIEVTPSPQLENMNSVDDIDEDEAFINELMALHPNDEDIIVEDVEFSSSINNESDQSSTVQQVVVTDDTNDPDEDESDGVRDLLMD